MASPEDLSPPWRMLLFGDASPTLVFGLLTGSPTEITLIRTKHLALGDSDGAPSGIESIAEPRVRREVFLGNKRGDILGYAASWWSKEDHDKHLADRSQPIGRSLSQRRTEVHRDIAGVYRGRNASLEAAFAEHGGAARGPAPGLWGRHYLFWHRGRPLTLIMEVFSPRLCKCLGPAAAVEDGAPTADVAE